MNDKEKLEAIYGRLEFLLEDSNVIKNPFLLEEILSIKKMIKE